MAAKQIIPFLLLLLSSSFVVCVLAVPLSWKSSSLIKKINRKGPYLGLITVYPPEENAFFGSGAFKPHPAHPYVDLSGLRFRIGKMQRKRVIYVRCGVGMVNAAKATQQMLDLFDIVGIVHFGIAGNANNSMSIGDVTIPRQFSDTGLWDWLKPNAKVPINDIAQLEFENYNVPKGGKDSLGRIGYSPEQFYSVSGEPNNYQEVFWFEACKSWLQLASNLEGMEIEHCVNSTLCLQHKPKLVTGLRASTANTFIDNAAYREFLFQTFHVSSVDMESAAVVMTSLSSGFPVIVMRGLSDLAGAQNGENAINLFGPLAASNVAKVVVQFVKLLHDNSSHHHCNQQE